jgi:hypothetical protein
VRLVATLGGCLVALVLAGCGNLPIARLALAPAEPPLDPRTVSVSVADLPGGLAPCPVSGQIDRYLRHLQVDGSPSYEVTAGQWEAMKRKGAVAGWVQSYAQSADDCAARLGERVGPSAISFAIRFKDAASALAGFNSGFLGLRPEPSMQAPGLIHGSQTQLTADAWTYDQTDQTPAVFVAFWANRQFDLFLLTERLPAAASLHAASDMNGRVH